ncbi:hypothetical protein C453_15803 [Haloferax elongans ATCC BAA-1513]|uniref:Uncharacterized protein n=1 Tax=Haloferax elongans ATCC BAA-1513 TaxID=1230453 RepID=M0HHK8_HALEO|nr:hypothetical protein [Haloferax elongans]ELZ82564.1 hypothetical protein C453_15803 [Haloferax elongans ATCC BAA-1513]
MNAWYSGSDGQYYSDTEIWERLEDGIWRVCCWNAETGEEWMETDAGELVHLAPAPDEQSRQSTPSESKPN